MSESSNEPAASVEQPVGTKVESTVESIGDGTQDQGAEQAEPQTETDQPEKSDSE